ncbi:MAG: 5-formyltetrahydrofolate cyclo-ligase [Rickettsiales bacterium]|nr:MAG: 5-formyltetrahydrofolate cyclo-ligase [Rickettsiales bacterium]
MQNKNNISAKSSKSNIELKKSLRKDILSRRKKLNEDDYFLANNIIIENVENLLACLKNETPSKKRVAGLYWPMKGEPDLVKLIINSNWRIALPKVRGVKMDFMTYKIGEQLELSMGRGVRQPQNNITLSPVVIIIPGLAFSIKGDRLGFGAGHYDRYFDKLGKEKDITKEKDVIKIGVCFDENLYEHLPNEPHDVKLNYIITEKTIIAL